MRAVTIERWPQGIRHWGIRGVLVGLFLCASECLRLLEERLCVRVHVNVCVCRKAFCAALHFTGQRSNPHKHTLKSMSSFFCIEISAPRITPIKIDNFSPRWSILFGVVQVVVPSVSVLLGEWAEESNWRTLRRTWMSVTKVNNESMQKINMIANSQLLRE